jgi:TPR repeat protein
MKSWLVAVLTALTLISTAPSALSQDRVGDDGCGSLAPGECRVAGLRAQFGLGETQDLVRALMLFEDACAQGDSFACTEAGVAYATGFGTTIEPELARAFYQKGCTADRHALCRDHGLSYLDPNSPARHFPKALTILSEACWIGSVEGCQQLASVNARAENGKAPLIGQIDAIRFFKEACILGSIEACVARSTMIDENPALSLFNHVRVLMLDLACEPANPERAINPATQAACALREAAAQTG